VRTQPRECLLHLAAIWPGEQERLSRRGKRKQTCLRIYETPHDTVYTTPPTYIVDSSHAKMHCQTSSGLGHEQEKLAARVGDSRTGRGRWWCAGGELIARNQVSQPVIKGNEVQSKRVSHTVQVPCRLPNALAITEAISRLPVRVRRKKRHHCARDQSAFGILKTTLISDPSPAMAADHSPPPSTAHSHNPDASPHDSHDPATPSHLPSPSPH